jgi:AAA family ATP:ADP antiporter
MQFSDPNSYSNFMGSYSMSEGLSTIAMSILWAILGTWLILKRGWRITALVGSISVLVGGLIFLGFLLANQSVSWLNQGAMVGLLKGTATALFFPLVQIIYLYMPEQVRFRTKVLTEMVILPLMKSLPSIAIQGLLIIFGSISAVTIYGEIFILILLILLVAASAIIGRIYNKT